MIIYQVTYESPVNGTQVCFFTTYHDAQEFGDVFKGSCVEPCVLHNRSFVHNRPDQSSEASA
jgi:hypothetical protein